MVVSHDPDKLANFWIAAFSAISILHSAVVSSIFGPLLSVGIKKFDEAIFLFGFLFFGSMFILALLSLAPVRSRRWTHSLAKLALIFVLGAFAVLMGGDLTARPVELAVTLVSWALSVHFIGVRFTAWKSS